MANNENMPFFSQRKPSYGTSMESNADVKPRGAAVPTSSASDGQTRSFDVAGRSNNNNNARSNRKTVDSPSILYCLHGTSKVEVRDHCHRQRSEGVDVSARKKLIIASVLCLFFMICEIIGGVLSNSLAIATDAAHLLTDFASFMISLFAIWIAGRPSTQRMSFGWYRAEVIGALASVVMIWFITAILVWLAVERLINRHFEVDAKIMLITSGLAILVNLIMGCQLQHGHTHGGVHGHAHSAKKTAKQQQRRPNLQCLTPTKLSTTLSLDTPANCPLPYGADPRSAKAVHIQEDLASNTSNTNRLQNSAEEDIENGNAGNSIEADAQMPSAGLQTFSYQNTSLPPNAMHAEMSAVLAETSLGGHHHGGAAAKDALNINVRAAYIHVLGDMVQSVGVFVAALVIYFRPDWVIVDPICTFIFSIIVLVTTFSIMKDALLVLMEGTPSYLHYTEVLRILEQIEGVERVHNLRIWALSINKVALSVHLAIGPSANPKKILQDATTAVHLRYNFFETTIQIEDFTPQMENCQQCTVPDT